MKQTENSPETNSTSRFNQTWTGVVLGIIVPAIAVVIFYLLNFTRVPFGFFIEHTFHVGILPKLISLCVIPNLGVFFLFIWRNYLYSARGVLMATFLITFLVIGLKAFA